MNSRKELKGGRVLFISYNGMLDPLGQSQVIPYLRELSKKGVNITLLSFERRDKSVSSDVEDLKRKLAAQNIQWHWLRYHQKPSLPATIYDVIVGLRYAQRLVRQNRIELVHARSHIPAVIALVLKRRFGIKMIFDLRGLMAEEYVDAEHWRKGSIPYLLTKTMERRALAASDGVVTLTERIWPIIKKWDGLDGREVIHEVVPCCADLELFKFRPEDRARQRAALGLTDEFVVVYSGSIDGWYLTDKMADFGASFLRRCPNAHFLWLTPNGHERIRTLMTDRGLSANYSILKAAAWEVPSYLSASDAGIAFIKSCFSKLASSPTKNGEYLACGLPVIINEGIGDADSLVTNERVGVLVKEFTEAEYERTLAAVGELFRQPDEIRKRARMVAERLFDVRRTGIDRYSHLYTRVLNL